MIINSYSDNSELSEIVIRFITRVLDQLGLMEELQHIKLIK